MLLDELKRLKEIADVGLLYSRNAYDTGQYEALREISLALLHKISGYDTEVLKESFPLAPDYPTPKVDIRGLVLSPEKKVLLAKESANG